MSPSPYSKPIHVVLKTDPLSPQVTTAHLYVDGHDISDHLLSISVHLEPGSPPYAQAALQIDKMEVDVDVAEAIVDALVPHYNIQRHQIENEPETFG